MTGRAESSPAAPGAGSGGVPGAAGPRRLRPMRGEYSGQDDAGSGR